MLVVLDLKKTVYFFAKRFCLIKVESMQTIELSSNKCF